MILCFGTYAQILLNFKSPATTQRELVAALVGTIDPDNRYMDKRSGSSVTRLIKCQQCFPLTDTKPKCGPKKDTLGSLTKIMKLVRSVDVNAFHQKFEPVLQLLEPHKYDDAVKALSKLILNDPALHGNCPKQHLDCRSIFAECLGGAVEDIEKLHANLGTCSFLARCLLYVVRVNALNKVEQDTGSLTDEKQWIEYLKDVTSNYASVDASGKQLANKLLEDGENQEDDSALEIVDASSSEVMTEIDSDRKSLGSQHKYVDDGRKICYPVHVDLPWQEFRLFPERFYVRNLYFIVFNYNNDYYVMLDTKHPVYMNVKENYEIPICSVPSVCEQFNPRDFGGFACEFEQTAGDFYRICNAALSETEDEAQRHGRTSLSGKLYDAEQNLFKHFDFNRLNPRSLNQHIEYRISFEQRDFDGKLRSECICYREFFCTILNFLSGKFYFDPECRQKYRFLPMSLLGQLKRRTFITETDVAKLYEDFHNKDAYWKTLYKHENSVYMDSSDSIYQFAGLNIPYYVHDALLMNIQTLQREAKVIMPLELLVHGEGALFHITLHNFYIHDKVESNCQVYNIFQKCVMAEDVKYYHVNDNYEITGVLNGKDFTSLLEGMYAELAKIMPARQIHLHLCCTALYGEYFFGRVSGLNADSPSFTGENYETLKRMAEKTLSMITEEGDSFYGILFGVKTTDFNDDLISFKPKSWTAHLPIKFGEESEDDIEMWFVAGSDTKDEKNKLRMPNPFF